MMSERTFLIISRNVFIAGRWSAIRIVPISPKINSRQKNINSTAAKEANSFSRSGDVLRMLAQCRNGVMHQKIAIDNTAIIEMNAYVVLTYERANPSSLVANASANLLRRPVPRPMSSTFTQLITDVNVSQMPYRVGLR